MTRLNVGLRLAVLLVVVAAEASVGLAYWRVMPPEPPCEFVTACPVGMPATLIAMAVGSLIGLAVVLFIRGERTHPDEYDGCESCNWLPAT